MKLSPLEGTCSKTNFRPRIESSLHRRIAASIKRAKPVARTDVLREPSVAHDLLRRAADPCASSQPVVGDAIGTPAPPNANGSPCRPACLRDHLPSLERRRLWCRARSRCVLGCGTPLAAANRKNMSRARVAQPFPILLHAVQLAVFPLTAVQVVHLHVFSSKVPLSIFIALLWHTHLVRIRSLELRLLFLRSLFRDCPMRDFQLK